MAMLGKGFLDVYNDVGETGAATLDAALVPGTVRGVH